MELTELISSIKMYNEAYRKGESQITDQDYDKLIEELKEKDPGNKLLEKAIIEIPLKRMERLPIPMFSLEKAKTIQEIFQWINLCDLRSEDRLIITPKFDGISLLVDENDRKAWTRGDGTEGQRSDLHYNELSGNRPIQKIEDFSYSFGEAIFPLKTFFENKGNYKSARNCIAGLFNSPETSSMLQYANLVRYGTDRDDLDKDTQLSLLKSSYYPATPWIVTSAGSFFAKQEAVKKWLTNIFNEICPEYKYDGLVIEINYAVKRKALGRLPNGNPRYAIAYKDPEWAERADTVVKEIEWNISKDGKAKPVIIFDPIELCGATVQRATAYNAKYLIENCICQGALISIARSGDVIPKHLKTLNYNRWTFHKEMDDMMICPSCGNLLKWNNTQTELVCYSPLCEERDISRLVYFFSILGMEEFAEPTIRKIYEAGFKSYESIVNISAEQLSSIEGVGSSLTETILSQFKKLQDEGVSFAKLTTALNVFEGLLAEKTCQKILDNLSKRDLLRLKEFKHIEKDTLTDITGIGEETANAFIRGLIKFNCSSNTSIKVSCYNKPLVEAAENQMAVCFSGIRDSVVEEWLNLNGHKVVNSISTKTTHLVVKTIGSGSSKETKASKLGVKIITFEDFIKEIDDIEAKNELVL